MMLHDTTDNARSVSRTPIETGVAVASRFRTLVASVRLEDAPTLPRACNSRARYELPSVRNRASAKLRMCAAGTARRGRKPAAKADLHLSQRRGRAKGCPDPGESNVRTRFGKVRTARVGSVQNCSMV